MALESRVSVIFPLLGSVFSRHLVSLLRVPSGFGSPLSPVLPRCSVTCSLSGRTSFPSFGSYHRPHACCLCSPSLSRPPLAARAFRVQAWALSCCGLPFFRFFRWGISRLPRFLGRPLFACPAHSTPADFRASPLTALPFCLPLLLQRRLLPFPISGLNHTACSFAVYASPSRLSRIHSARLASGWLASLCRTGLSPVGSSSKGFLFDLLHRRFLLSQTCPGAQKVAKPDEGGALRDMRDLQTLVGERSEARE